MIYHGKPPFLECSSAGDKRFSAYFAKLRSYGGKSIEEIYQSAKVFSCGATGLSIKDWKTRIRSNSYPKSWNIPVRTWANRSG